MNLENDHLSSTDGFQQFVMLPYVLYNGMMNTELTVVTSVSSITIVQ